MKRVICSIVLLALALTQGRSAAEVWEWSCESAIRQLSSAQQDVAYRYTDYESALRDAERAKSALESAESDVESKRRQYDWCTPSDYNDCEWERTQLNRAIEDYNDALDKYNRTVEDYDAALDDLNSAISDFASEVDAFSRQCTY